MINASIERIFEVAKQSDRVLTHEDTQAVVDSVAGF